MEITSYFKIACLLLLTVNYKKINFYKIPLKIIQYLKKNKNKDKKLNVEVKELIFIKDGEEEIIYDINKNIIIKNNLRENLFQISNYQHDFLIYNDNNNLIRLNNIGEYFNIQDNGYVIKRQLFLSLKLIIKKSNEITLEFNINLKSLNFFVENNKILDYPFIRWYANKSLNLELDKEDYYYFILLDNNIKEYKLNKYNKIVITNEYFIIEDDQYCLVE